MSAVIGVRRSGETRVSFVTATNAFVIGDRVLVEIGTETVVATVAIAADQVLARPPAITIIGNARAHEAGGDERTAMHSLEDDRYRARKARFPVLGERVSQGAVVRIDLRHETVDVRDDRGEIATVPLFRSEEPEPESEGA